jgi:hypothetical protein
MAGQSKVCDENSTNVYVFRQASIEAGGGESYNLNG